jgi:aryl-alcohol dehydrogenase-like predicted oxidoreductase
MRYRPLGTTGLNVSEVGFGAWAIGGAWWGPQDDGDSRRALHQALDMGCNFIDTAWVYGDGHSERLIAGVLKERRETPIVATKVPPKNWDWDNRPGTPLADAFPPDWVEAKAEESLRRLGVERIDILQLHTWASDWNVQSGELLSGVERLKRSGKIRAFGLSLRDKGPGEANDLIRRRQVDTLQIFFNLLYQEPLEAVFPLAKDYGVGVIARVPLAFGALSGKFNAHTRFEGDDHRQRLYAGEGLKVTLAKVQKLSYLAKAGGRTGPANLAEAALAWTLAAPAVSTTIPGIRNPRQARLNCRVGDLAPLPLAAARRAEALYRRNFGLPVRAVPSLEGIPAVLVSGFRTGKPARKVAGKSGTGSRRKRTVPKAKRRR